MQKQLVATTAMIAFMLLLSPVYAQERVEDHLDKKNESILGIEKEDGTLYSVEEAMNTYGLKGLSVECLFRRDLREMRYGVLNGAFNRRRWLV